MVFEDSLSRWRSTAVDGSRFRVIWGNVHELAEIVKRLAKIAKWWLLFAGVVILQAIVMQVVSDFARVGTELAI